MRDEDKFYAYRHRTLCDVLSDMRRCDDTKNYAGLASLIEEAQSLGNRMESGLSMKSDLAEWDKDWTEKKNEMKKLYEEYAKAKALAPEKED